MAASNGTVVWASADERWFHAVNRFAAHTPWLHTPARLYAEYGVVLFAGLLLWSWWRARAAGDPRRMAAALWAPVGMLIAVGLNQLIGSAVAEPRPYTVLPHTLVLVSRSTDYSFPSDHAVMAGAVAAGIDGIRNRLEAPAPVMGMAYGMDGVADLPTALGAALDALEADTALRAALGEEFVKLFVAVKRHEIGKARAAIGGFDAPAFRDTVDEWERAELFEFL